MWVHRVGVLLGSVGLVTGLASCGPPYPVDVEATLAGDTITITWSEVPDTTSYDVCRKMEGYFTSSGDCSDLTPCEDTLGTSCSYDETASPEGETTTYTYRVRADDGDWGEWSNAVTH
jgi:hypothetical protein